jgi:hypothetical protein
MTDRLVRFYEIVNENGERFPNTLPFEDLQRAVQDLPDEDAYVSVSRMELLGSSYIVGAGARPGVSLFMLDRITRDVRLRIERRRNYRPLVLDPEETLAEPTFYSIFDRNVLAVMRNSGSAPGPASFRDYINNLKLTGEVGINVVPLVDRNALRAIGDIGTLTRLNIRVGPDATSDLFGQSRTIAGAIRYFRENFGSVGIEVGIRIAPKGQSEISELTVSEVQGLLSSNAFGHMDKAEIAYRSIENGRAQTHDFIQESVATSVSVELSDQTSQPTELSVSQAIAEAYDDLNEDILSTLNATS